MTTAPAPHVSPTAWVVWGAGIAAYAVAIMQRTSLGVVGVQAAEHFGTTVGIVSTFVVVQIATYALMQVPAGLLLDRFGSRTMMMIGSLVMGIGQVTMALTDMLPVAIGARILVGMGDSAMFSSIVRMLPAWFPSRRVPVLSQLTGLFGQLGQIASVGALLPIINNQGWRPTFTFAAGCSVVIAIVSWLVVRDVPDGVEVSRSNDKLSELPRNIAAVARHPATTLGFWIHWTSGFAANAFVLMWGIPYLTIGQGLSDAAASSLFILTALLGGIFGPTLGWLTGRHPLRRSTLALMVVWANIVMWSVVSFWDGPAPMWVLVLLIVAVSAGGPGTAIGLDLARTQIPAKRLGAATGIVITGSFSGGTLTILLIGLVLDVLGSGGDYSGADIRMAMMVQLPIFMVGLVGIFLSRRSLRAQMLREGVVVPKWSEVARRYRKR